MCLSNSNLDEFDVFIVLRYLRREIKISSKHVRTNIRFLFRSQDSSLFVLAKYMKQWSVVSCFTCLSSLLATNVKTMEANNPDSFHYWNRVAHICSLALRDNYPLPAWQRRTRKHAVSGENSSRLVAFRGVIRLFRHDSKSQGYRSNTTAEGGTKVDRRHGGGGTSVPRPTMLDCHFQYLSPSCWTGHVYPSMVARRGICRPLLSPISSLFVLVIHLI